MCIRKSVGYGSGATIILPDGFIVYSAAGGVAGVRDNKKVSVSQSPPPDLENLVNQENCQPLPSVRPNVRCVTCKRRNHVYSKLISQYIHIYK